MLTNSEFGQANVFISTIYAFLETEHDAEIHIASFPSLEEAAQNALAPVTKGKGITFHTLPGRAMFECMNAEPDPANRIFAVSSLKPGFWNTPSSARFILTKGLICWSPEEFAAIFHTICDLIKDISPDLIIIDQILAPGLTAAKHMKEIVSTPFKIAILSPNSLKDYVHHLEPRAAVLWKWPQVGSALPMPIPWYYIPLNIYFMFRMIGILVTDKNVPTMTKRVRELTKLPQLNITTNVSLCNDGLEGIDKVLIGARPEVDFPNLDLVNPPKAYLEKLVACGPILRPFIAVEGELLAWMKRGPVVYINLGTHCLTSEAEAVAMAHALRLLISTYSESTQTTGKLQVLWKLKKDLTRGPDFSIGPGSEVFEQLGEGINEDRVRIVNWLDSEPNSILNTGNVICAVSHGGANSFYEAVW